MKNYKRFIKTIFTIKSKFKKKKKKKKKKPVSSEAEMELSVTVKQASYTAQDL